MKNLTDYLSTFLYSKQEITITNPLVIPAVRSWTSNNLQYQFVIPNSDSTNDPSRIVCSDVRLTNLINTFKSDLDSLTNSNILITNDTGKTGDIVCSLAPEPIDSNSERYTILISNIIKITGYSEIGLFWGTRTLLQLLKQNFTVKGGFIDDSPAYPERSLMIDIGRKYFTPGWIKNKIKELSYLKINYLHLHLSDNEGFYLESNFLPMSSIYITKNDLVDIVNLGLKYYVNIVPEFDMPAHMRAILTPEYALTYDNGQQELSVLNFNDQGTLFAKRIIDEYIDFFPCKYFHIGADEVGVSWNNLTNLKTYIQTKMNDPTLTAVDAFYYFVNNINSYVKEKNKTLRIWASSSNSKIKFDSDIVMELWDSSTNPNSISNKVMNCSFYPMYYVQGWELTQREQYTPDVLYEQWNPTLIFSEVALSKGTPMPTNPNLRYRITNNLLGGKYQIWSDNPNIQSESTVGSNTYAHLRALSQCTWGTNKLVSKFTDFQNIITAVGKNPGIIPQILAFYNVNDVIINPNKIITPARVANLTANGGFGWQTKMTIINVLLNNYIFTLDNGNGNYMEYSGSIAGTGSVDIIGSSSLNVPIIFSGGISNLFNGKTTLVRGSLLLSKPPNIVAIPGDLVINNADNASVKWTNSYQMSPISNINCLCTNGSLILNNCNETINVLSLAFGSNINLGSGTFTVNKLIYGGIGYRQGIYNTNTNIEFLLGLPGGQLIVKQDPLFTPYTFQGEITDPNMTIRQDQFGNLMGDGTFGWKTKKTSINLATNGFIFTLDNGNGNYLEYSGVISGPGSVHIDGTPYWANFVSVVLSGSMPNTYTGKMILLKGQLEFAKNNNIICVNGDLIVNNYSGNNSNNIAGEQLIWRNSYQFNPLSNIQFNSQNGIINLNNKFEKINILNMINTSKINLGSGILTVNKLIYNNFIYDAGIYNSTNLTFVSGFGQIIVLQGRSNKITQKIMCLGDSITMLDSSYRYPLSNLLNNSGIKYVMVGDLIDERGLHHEGLNGATIGPGEPNEWGDDPSKSFKNNIFNNISSLLTKHNPNIILLLIGVNDFSNYRDNMNNIIQYDAINNSSIKLTNLLNIIFTSNPDISIYLSKLLPVSDQKKSTFKVEDFNVKIVSIYNNFKNLKKNIYLIDNYNIDINPNDTTQLYDGLHPTPIIGAKIATVWFNALNQNLNF